jgi:two-component system, sensor histidine kinase
MSVGGVGSAGEAEGREAGEGATSPGSARELAAEVISEERRQAWELALLADRKKDTFIAILAHELRNLLAPVRNAAALLGADPADAATLSRARRIIERQVAGMSRLIDDLLDVARLRLGEFELQRSSTPVSDIFDRTVETMRSFVVARGHDLIVSVPAEPLYVDADVLRLSQVLQNLLSNAAKYTSSGGVIRLTARREGDSAVLAVSDNGKGIAPGQAEKIFDIYAQAGEADSERSEGGLGIGLYLARRLIEAHGGSITATSEGLGEGSSFEIRLACRSARP